MATNIRRVDRVFFGTGAPETGDLITAADDQYPLGSIYINISNGTQYTRTGISKVTGDWTSSGGGSSSYLVYTALLNQTGTNAPVATVLENTLGGTVVWSYSSVGAYFGTLNGAFPSGKCFFSIISDNINNIYTANRGSDNVIAVNTGTNDAPSLFIPLNDLLVDASFEVRVYP